MKKPIKYLVRCDMEGISGIVSYDQADPTGAEYTDGRKYFHSDLNALIQGLFEGGADEVHIYDEHFYGRNIDLTLLKPVGEDKKLVLYNGKPPYRADWAGGLDESFRGLILLGFHSMRGTGELLHHSYEPDIRALRINGIPVGEIGIEAAIAGDLGVGLAMITADSAGSKEAQQLVGEGLTAVSVKESLSECGGICYPLEDTANTIHQAACRVATRGTAAKPFHCAAPVDLEVELFDTPYAQKYMELYGSSHIIGNSALACWAEYWKRKLEVQSKL